MWFQMTHKRESLFVLSSVIHGYIHTSLTNPINTDPINGVAQLDAL